MLNSMNGYTSKVIKGNNLEAKETNVEYALLPVWMVNIKYKDKYYLFAMNGESGKFIGNITLDKKRALMCTIITFIIAFIICVVASYVIFTMGGAA